MFWLRNKKNNFQLRTHIWGPGGPHNFIENFSSFSPRESMGAKDHLDMANLYPEGIVGRIYVGVH